MSLPLHAVFTELLRDDAARQAYAADPGSVLEGAGHTGLPDELVAEAIAGFADTASPAVAEHLAPFVIAHSPVRQPGTEPAELDGLALLATAPSDVTSEQTDADRPQSDGSVDARADDDTPLVDLGFGTGSDFEPGAAPADGFDDVLTEIPATAEPAEPAPMGDGALLGTDPALEVDEAEPPEDLDSPG